MSLVGLDHLGLAHKLYPVKKVIQAAAPNSIIGVFDDPFGPVLNKLRKCLDSGKYKAARIQAHWDNLHRIVPLQKLKKKLPAYEKLSKDYPGIDIFVSHSCEYKEASQVEVRKRVDLIRSLAPSCIPVNSVWQGATLPNVITERHGQDAIGGMVSYDGTNAYDSNVEGWKQRNAGAYQLFWGYRFNLREINDEGQPVPPPSQRTAAPSLQYIQSVQRLGEYQGLPMNPVFQARPIAAPELYKSHAEDDQESGPLDPDDPRENRPCLILKTQAQEIKIVTWDNKEIGKFKYGGTFGSNMKRFYAGSPGGVGLYGYQIGNKAKKVSGSEFVWFKSGNSYHGPVHPAFRAGYFR